MKLRAEDQEWRVLQSVKSWNRMNFITVTLIEQEDDPKVISSRFTAWVKDLRRFYCPGLRVIRVLQEFEKGHGWHIHALFDRFIPDSIMNRVGEACGLGRLDFRMVSHEDRERSIAYIVRYITRDMRNRWKNPALKGVRLLTASGHLKSSVRWWLRLADITIIDTGNESRKVLQCLHEIRGRVFRFKNGRHRPMRLADLIHLSSPEIIKEWLALINGAAHLAKIEEMVS